MCIRDSYKDMPLASEVLLRAAVVQTLVQIAGVDYIDFFIEDEPLTDRNGNLIGYMPVSYTHLLGNGISGRSHIP